MKRGPIFGNVATNRGPPPLFTDRRSPCSASCATIARLRIAEEVSLYGLNMREATAEMFKVCWCSTDDAPSGLVAPFGELLDRFSQPA